MTRSHIIRLFKEVGGAPISRFFPRSRPFGGHAPGSTINTVRIRSVLLLASVLALAAAASAQTGPCAGCVAIVIDAGAVGSLPASRMAEITLRTLLRPLS